MSSENDVVKICETIKEKYSPCDVSDALLKAKVPGAGFLPDIGKVANATPYLQAPTHDCAAPIPSRPFGANRMVAPISTVIFVPKSHTASSYPCHDGTPLESNLPKDKHWTDCPASGSIVILQQPPKQNAALLGDIVATRLKTRGVAGAVIDGRSRDIVSCAELCEGGDFQIWTKALSSVGTSLEAKPWAVDVPIRISDTVVRAGDILCADEVEKVLTVIPRGRVEEIVELLPVLKEADDGVLKDVQGGIDLKTAFGNHPKHYSNR